MTKKLPEPEERLFNQLKDILLHEDREKLKEIEDILKNRSQLSEKVSPIIEEHLDFLKENFPIEFRRSVEKIVDKRIKQSHETLLNIIYPKLGRMIQKYVSQRFQLLRESIEDQLRQSWIGNLRARMMGVNESELIMSKLDQPLVEEIYVIRKESGLLIGSASKGETINKELIGGMLTAIKAFVEDAFLRGEEELEMIQYGNYEITIQNYFNYYIAVAVSGNLTVQQRENLLKTLEKFAERELSRELKEGEGETHLYLKRKLEKYFFRKISY